MQKVRFSVGPKTVQFIVAGAVIVASLGYLGYQGIQASAAYTLGLSDLITNQDQYLDKRVQVGGKVVQGSVDQSTGVLLFKIAESDSVVSVRYVGSEPIPDGIHADDAEATVTGMLRSDGCVEAVTIRTKCASKYRPEPEATS